MRRKIAGTPSREIDRAGACISQVLSRAGPAGDMNAGTLLEGIESLFGQFVHVFEVAVWTARWRVGAVR